MADYNRLYNLTVKDSLPTGNSAKVIKGAELDAELNAVASAIASKSDSNSPTFTGTPAAPTATLGTNTTQLATTAFVQAALNALYPVGSIYINASVTTNPASLLGFGTWVAFGEGRVIVGQNTSDTDFDTLEETGGSKASVAAHTHTFTTGTESVGHTHSGTTSAVSNDHTHSFSGTTGTMNSNWAHSHSVNDPGHVHGFYPFYAGSPGAGATGWDGDPDSIWQTRNTNSATTGITINSTDINHTHNFSGTTSGISANHTHTITTGGVSASHTHSGTTASTGNSNGNLQPYVVVKMWKRTA
jgi:hypothetical protein